MTDNINTTLSRRRFLQWSAVGIGGAAIAACAAPAAPAAAPEEAEMPAEETITISWWHQWGGTTGMAAMEGVAAAFEFIEFCSDEKAQNVIFDNTGWLGGRKALYDPDLPKYQCYENLDWFLRSVNEADELWACPVIPIQGFVNQQRSRTYESVIFGDKDAEQAAADMQVACTEELLKQFPELVG